MIGSTISHYKIIEKLGEGGMGVVYKAEDTKLHRLVALKFFPPQGTVTQESKIRFQHEAEAAALLDHPNICQVYEIDEVDGPAGTGRQLFIAMAYIDGLSIKEKIAASPLKLHDAVEIAIQVGEGLKEAHEKGIVHRDIKSANIMITLKGQVKIMDFGLAHLSGRTTVTQSGTALGTAAYMSPEQTRGEKIDHRADIWAFGVVLYEMITGVLPFKGEYDQAVVYQILHDEAEPITGVRTGVPMELERIVNKAMRKESSHRYQHVDEMIVDLVALDDEMTSGTPLMKGSGQQRFKNIPRFYFYSGGGIICALIVIVGLYTYFGRGKVINAIAVLPFNYISNDSSMEVFSDILTSSIINSLSPVSQLHVMASSTVFHYKNSEIEPQKFGHDLNVGAVLAGHLIHRSDHVIVNTELVDVSDGSQIWGKQYDVRVKDIFKIQDEIASEVSRTLKIKLTGEEKSHLKKHFTENSEAYRLYLRGRSYLNQFPDSNFKKGMEYFNKAIQADSSFALAYTGLADGYYLHSVDASWCEQARRAALQALKIDETLSEAHASLGVILAQCDKDWQNAEKEYRRAIELNPGYANAHHYYGWYLIENGRTTEAITELTEADQLDPLPLLWTGANVAWAYFMARQYDKSIEHSLSLLVMDSTFGTTHANLGMAYEQKSMFNEAIEEFKKTIVRNVGSSWIQGLLGHAYAISGKRAEAMAIIEELEREAKRDTSIDPYDIATIYVGLGEKDLAFPLMENALNHRSENLLATLKIDPRFDNIRSDPRYIALLNKMGLEK